MEKINKNDYQIWGRWVQDPLSGGFWSRWCDAASLSFLGSAFVCRPIIFIDGHTGMHKDVLDSLDELVASLFEDGGFDEVSEKLDTYSRRVEKKHLALLDSDLELKPYINKLFVSYAEMLGPWVGASFLSYALEKYAVENGIAKDEDEMLMRMKPYWRYTLLEEQTQEMKKMLTLMQAIKNDLKAEDIDLEFINSNPDVKKLFDQHLKDYDWFGAHHWVGGDYGGNDAEQVISDLKALFEKGELEIEPRPEEDEAEEYKELWSLMAKCVYWRTHAAVTTAIVTYRSRGKLTELAEGWGLDYEGLRLLTSQEVSNAMEKSMKEIELPENYLERKDGYSCVINDKREDVVLTGEKLQKQLNQLLDDVDEDIKELTGAVASKGETVRGKAHIVISHKDVDGFEEGDVLVIPETSPEFVPVMKMASAIVTEAGGVTSHAAIVSRELKKPCIINTKIATRLIKNGQEIEVDTDTGTVTIL